LLVYQAMDDHAAKVHAIQPWESSPEIFTLAAHALRLLQDFRFVEVLSLEKSLPKSTIALVLVYPTPSNYETQKMDCDKRTDN